jgi:hypothetical protein
MQGKHLSLFLRRKHSILGIESRTFAERLRQTSYLANLALKADFANDLAGIIEDFSESDLNSLAPCSFRPHVSLNLLCTSRNEDDSELQVPDSGLSLSTVSDWSSVSAIDLSVEARDSTDASCHTLGLKSKSLLRVTRFKALYAHRCE